MRRCFHWAALSLVLQLGRPSAATAADDGASVTAEGAVASLKDRILQRSAAGVGRALISDAASDEEIVLACTTRLLALGKDEDGVADMDGFAAVGEGQAVAALVKALEAHAGNTRLTLAGMELLTGMASGFAKVHGHEWRRSDEAAARRALLVSHGTLELAVGAMKRVGFDEAKNAKAFAVQRTAAGLIGNLCFSHRPDAEGVGPLRERAASAGAIEALFEVVRAHKKRRFSSSIKKKASKDLLEAMEGLLWVAVGTGEEGRARRQRIVDLKPIDLFMDVTDRWYSEELGDVMWHALQISIRPDYPGDADEALKEELEAALEKRVELRNRIRENHFKQSAARGLEM